MSDNHDSQRLSESKMASVHMDHRREERYAATIPIDVTGVCQDGTPFYERTTTTNMSEWGCGFSLPMEISVDAIVALRVVGQEGEGAVEPILFQVVRAKSDGKTWEIGAWKLGEGHLLRRDVAKLGKPLDGTEKLRAQGGANGATDPPLREHR